MILNLYRRVCVVARQLARLFNTRENEMSERRLGVYAHPDDEALTGYTLTEEGVGASVVVASDGTTSTINYHEDPGFVQNGRRREEAIASFVNLGIPYEPPDPSDPFKPKRQNYLGLPDGELDQHRSTIAERLTAIIIAKEIDTVVTTGIDGYDTHEDHITMFWATVAAINIVRLTQGKSVKHITLNSDHLGAIAITPTAEMRRKKLASMACNRSQHDVRVLQEGEQTDDRIIDSRFAVGREFDQAFQAYWPLLEKETYDVVSPDAISEPEPESELELTGQAS